MKRLKVTYRTEAKDDLLQIYRWVYEASLDPEVAGRFLDRLVERCDRIGDAPHGGRPRDDLELGLRTVPFEHSAVAACGTPGDRVDVRSAVRAAGAVMGDCGRASCSGIVVADGNLREPLGNGCGGTLGYRG